MLCQYKPYYSEIFFTYIFKDMFNFLQIKFSKVWVKGHTSFQLKWALPN